MVYSHNAPSHNSPSHYAPSHCAPILNFVPLRPHFKLCPITPPCIAIKYKTGVQRDKISLLCSYASFYDIANNVYKVGRVIKNISFASPSASKFHISENLFYFFIYYKCVMSSEFLLTVLTPKNNLSTAQTGP